MAKARPDHSPLEAATGAAGEHAIEAFALLGDETRLAILLSLWEEYDPHADDNEVPFSRIRERLAYDDAGNLRYHLEKLRGQFVHQRAAGEGYRLREPGLQLVRAVIAGAGAGATRMGPTEIAQPCLLCGAPTTISYRDGSLVWACTECDGATPEATDVEGFLSATPFDAAGVADRTPEEIRLASIAKVRAKRRMLFDGFCPDCSGPVDGWLDCCPDHDADGLCEHCGTRFVAWARFTCRVCKRHGISSPKALALFHPAVVSFYDDHGVPIRVQADDFEGARRLFEHTHDHRMELRSTEPTRLQVTAALDGDEIGLTFDETVSVTTVDR